MYEKLKDRIKKIGVRDKIKLATGCLASALIFISIIGSMSIASLKSNITSYHEVAGASSAIAGCRINLNTIARCLREMVLEANSGGHDTYISQIEELKADNEAQLAVLEQCDYISTATLEAYKNSIADWYAVGEEIIEAVVAYRPTEAAGIVQRSCNPSLEELIFHVDNLNTQIQTEMDRVEKYSNMISWISLINNAVILVIGIFFAVFLTRKLLEDISVPVEAIQSAAKSMEEGHLNFALNFHSHDEMGAMADSLRHAASILSGYIKDVSRAMTAFSQGHFDVQPEMEWTGDFKEIYFSVIDFEKKYVQACDRDLYCGRAG